MTYMEQPMRRGTKPTTPAPLHCKTAVCVYCLLYDKATYSLFQTLCLFAEYWTQMALCLQPITKIYTRSLTIQRSANRCIHNSLHRHEYICSAFIMWDTTTAIQVHINMTPTPAVTVLLYDVTTTPTRSLSRLLACIPTHTQSTSIHPSIHPFVHARPSPVLMAYYSIKTDKWPGLHRLD